MKQIYPRLLILLASAILFQIPGESQKKLSIIGSSTSACFGINGDSCYVGRLQYFYGSTVQVTNLAVSGSSVYRGMPSSYTPPPQRSTEPPDVDHNITAALNTHPDVVLVNYPSNGYDVYSVAEVMLCLRTINETAISAGAKCYITTTQPRSDPASYSTSETRRKMAEIKDSVLREFGLFAINFWVNIVNPADSTIIASLGQGDGTHLNSSGHAILFQKVQQKNMFADNSPLPVRYIDFTAKEGTGVTLLQWTTALEENIRQYEILRSEDGIHFNTIGSIKSHNSTGENSYSFSEKAPFTALTYYKIAAVDINNHRDYSQVAKVARHEQSFSIKKIFYKNSLLYASVESGERQIINLQVLSGTGQVLTSVRTTVSAGVNTLPVNVSLPARGAYFLRIAGNRGLKLKSFVRD